MRWNGGGLNGPVGPLSAVVIVVHGSASSQSGSDVVWSKKKANEEAASCRCDQPLVFVTGINELTACSRYVGSARRRHGKRAYTT